MAALAAVFLVLLVAAMLADDERLAGLVGREEEKVVRRWLAAVGAKLAPDR